MVVWNEVAVAPPQSRYNQRDRFRKKKDQTCRGSILPNQMIHVELSVLREV